MREIVIALISLILGYLWGSFSPLLSKKTSSSRTHKEGSS